MQGDLPESLRRVSCGIEACLQRLFTRLLRDEAAFVEKYPFASNPFHELKVVLRLEHPAFGFPLRILR
jgi:hypothetical protein